MDKNQKTRGGKSKVKKKESSKDKGQTDLPGSPSSSNRQTGGHQKDDSGGSKTNTTKKGPNSI